MKRLILAIKGDILFQFRQGFYTAYFLVVVFYIVLLKILPDSIREQVATLALLGDTTVLGFTFVGGIVLLERGQGILQTLFVTPLTFREYLLSKVASLTVLALLVSFLIVIFTFGASFNAFFLAVAVTLNSSLFTLIGLSLSSRVTHTNHYIFSIAAMGVVLFLPILGYLDLFSLPIFYLFPTYPALQILRMVFEPQLTSLLTKFLLFAYQLLWIVGVWFLTCRWFDRYVVQKTGGGM